jgi:hypothetical protein
MAELGFHRLARHANICQADTHVCRRTPHTLAAAASKAGLRLKRSKFSLERPEGARTDAFCACIADDCCIRLQIDEDGTALARLLAHQPAFAALHIRADPHIVMLVLWRRRHRHGLLPVLCTVSTFE